jgi:hypothetical protein
MQPKQPFRKKQPIGNKDLDKWKLLIEEEKEEERREAHATDKEREKRFKKLGVNEVKRQNYLELSIREGETRRPGYHENPVLLDIMNGELTTELVERKKSICEWLMECLGIKSKTLGGGGSREDLEKFVKENPDLVEMVLDEKCPISQEQKERSKELLNLLQSHKGGNRKAKTQRAKKSKKSKKSTTNRKGRRVTWFRGFFPK